MFGYLEGFELAAMKGKGMEGNARGMWQFLMSYLDMSRRKIEDNAWGNLLKSSSRPIHP